MKLNQFIRAGMACILAGTLAACGGGGGGGGTTTSGNGSLKLAMTDAPSCGYDNVYVTVDKVRVHTSASAGDGDTGWAEVNVRPTQRVDLLSLTNGVLFELGQTPLPAGKYTQMRLVLTENSVSTPLANAVTPTGGAIVPLKTPSGQQSGLKFNINIDVAANQLADFVIDFDACKSVVKAGNSGNYNLKPVLTVIPRLISGVSGFLVSSLAGSTVSLQQGGVVHRSTVVDSTGKFLLQPVVPGTYTLVIAAPGRATAIVTNVVVANEVVTTLNLDSAAIDPPASPTGTLAGAVAAPGTPIEATVRATQTLGSGTVVEVTSGVVDGSNGAYSYVLPTGAPMVAPYAASPNPLVFAADAGAAGKYSLQAIDSNGAVKNAGPVTLASGATVATNFTFP